MTAKGRLDHILAHAAAIAAANQPRPVRRPRSQPRQRPARIGWVAHLAWSTLVFPDHVIIVGDEPSEFAA